MYYLLLFLISSFTHCWEDSVTWKNPLNGSKKYGTTSTFYLENPSMMNSDNDDDSDEESDDYLQKKSNERKEHQKIAFEQFKRQRAEVIKNIQKGTLSLNTIDENDTEQEFIQQSFFISRSTKSKTQDADELDETQYKYYCCKTKSFAFNDKDIYPRNTKDEICPAHNDVFYPENEFNGVEAQIIEIDEQESSKNKNKKRHSILKFLGLCCFKKPYSTH